MSPRLAPSIVKPFGEWARGCFFSRQGSSVTNLHSVWVGCRQLPEWSIRCLTNRNAEDLLPWLELNRISAVLSLLMLFSGSNPVVDSSSKFLCGEQRHRLEEHPLSWGSCLKSRLMLCSASIHSGVAVDSGCPSLYSRYTLSSALSREEVVMCLSSGMRRRGEFCCGAQAQCHNPGGYPAVSVGVEAK